MTHTPGDSKSTLTAYINQIIDNNRHWLAVHSISDSTKVAGVAIPKKMWDLDQWYSFVGPWVKLNIVNKQFWKNKEKS